jgi:hypothetical protein
VWARAGVEVVGGLGDGVCPLGCRAGLTERWHSGSRALVGDAGSMGADGKAVEYAEVVHCCRALPGS